MTKHQLRALLLAKIHLLLLATGGVSVLVKAPKLGARVSTPTYRCQCTLERSFTASAFLKLFLAGTRVPAAAEEITVTRVHGFNILKFTLKLVGTSFSGGDQ